MEELLKKTELSEEELREIVGGATHSGREYEVTWECKYCHHKKKTKNTLDHGLCKNCHKDGYVAIDTKWL